jgi:hypothetical protein
MFRTFGRLIIGALVAGVIAVAPSTAEAQAGIKGGFLYSSLKFENTSDVIDSNNGWTAGVFFGTGKDKIAGVQGEVNVLQKGGSTASGDVKLYYLQVPVLLRVGGGSKVNVYGIVGPSFDVKLAEKGDTLGFVTEFEGVDVSLTGGVGVEIGKLVLEGRGNWGLRNVAKTTSTLFEGEKLTSRSFALQVGVRF